MSVYYGLMCTSPHDVTPTPKIIRVFTNLNHIGQFLNYEARSTIRKYDDENPTDFLEVYPIWYDKQADYVRNYKFKEDANSIEEFNAMLEDFNNNIHTKYKGYFKELNKEEIENDTRFDMKFFNPNKR